MSVEETVDELRKAISSLQTRIEKLEDLVVEKSNRPLEEVEDIPEAIAEENSINFESFSGASQIGWLGIAVFLICCFFFVRYSFQQSWVSGMGQTAVLAGLGLVLFLVSDNVKKRQHRKFGATLAVLSATLFFMAVYWSCIEVQKISPRFLLFATLFLWLGFLVWGRLRKSSLWPLLGVAGSCLMPIFVIRDFAGTDWFAFYFFVVLVGSFIFALLQNGSALGLIATLATQGFLVLYIRNVYPLPQDHLVIAILGMTTLFSALFILWSGLVPLFHNRSATASEKFTWFANNVLLYSYIFAFWGKFNKPGLVLIPVSANALLYFASVLRNSRQSREFFYVLGSVVATAIAMTILLPIPFDIITLCLFTVLLGHKGNQENGWHLKSVSGGMVIWCLLFLFAKRFHFSTPDETPFLNLRFSSFVIAFLCFGYHGRMINNDLNAKLAGPVLGQGLFCLGLAVLLLGMGGEILHVFPPKEQEKISPLALLFLTLLGGSFAFAVAYIGRILKLFFIRILAVLFCLLLVVKLLVFDLFMLKLLYLIISLGSVALFLGGTSFLLKNKGEPLFQPSERP